MALGNWYLNDSPAAGAHKKLATSNSGAAATTTTGWVVAKNAAGNFGRMDTGVERAANTMSTTAQPSGAPDTSAPWDCFVLGDDAGNAINGSFATGAWTFRLPSRAVTSASGPQQGRARFRLWRGPNLNGSGATEITAGTQIGSTITGSTTVTATSSVTTGSITGFTLTNEFLFLQVAWETVVAGGATGSDVDIRSSENVALATSPTFSVTQSVTNGTISATVLYEPTVTRMLQEVTGATISSTSVNAPSTVFVGTFPTIAGYGTGHGGSFAGPQAVDLTIAGTAAPGDLLVVFFATGLNGCTFPVGWSSGGTAGSWNNGSFRYQLAARIVRAGDPTSINVTVGGSGSAGSSWAIYRITGYKFTATLQYIERIEDTAGVFNYAPTYALNPTTWDLEATLWLATAWVVNGSITSAPTGFSGLTTDTYPGLGTAYRNDGVANEPAGQFNATNVTRSLSIVVAIPPVDATSYTGPFDVFPAAISSGSVLYEPTVSAAIPSQDVTAGTISATSVTAPDTVSPGAVTVVNGTISTTTVTAPTVVPGAVDVTASFISATSVTEPSVSAGALTVTTPALAETVLYEPTVIPGDVAITTSTVSATSLNVPTVAPGAVTVTLPSISSTNTAAPTVAPGAVTVTGASVSSTALYPSTITPGAVTVAGATISVTSLAPPVVSQGAVNVLVPLLAASTALYAPSISTDYSIVGATLASSAVLYVPTIDAAAPGQSVAVPWLASSASLSAPSLTVGPVAVVLPLLGPTSVTYAVAVTYEVAAGTIVAATALYPPAVEPGAASVETSTISGETMLFAPSVLSSGELTTSHIFSTVLYSPRKIYRTGRRTIQLIASSSADNHRASSAPAGLTASTSAHEHTGSTSDHDYKART